MTLTHATNLNPERHSQLFALVRTLSTIRHQYCHNPEQASQLFCRCCWLGCRSAWKVPTPNGTDPPCSPERWAEHRVLSHSVSTPSGTDLPVRRPSRWTAGSKSISFNPEREEPACTPPYDSTIEATNYKFQSRAGRTVLFAQEPHMTTIAPCACFNPKREASPKKVEVPRLYVMTVFQPRTGISNYSAFGSWPGNITNGVSPNPEQAYPAIQPTEIKLWEHGVDESQPRTGIP